MTRNNKRKDKFKKKDKTRKFNKQDSAWLQHFKKFNDVLKTKNLYLKDIEADGNCLFRAISDQLHGNEDYHIQYRLDAVSYIKENKEFYTPFIGTESEFDEYIIFISQQGTWGGNLELQALSHTLNTTIIIHNINGTHIFIENNNGEGNINIAYHSNELFPDHYSSVREIGSDSHTKSEFNFVRKRIKEINIENNDWGSIKPYDKQCECGSQKKYKHCCFKKEASEEASDHEHMEQQTEHLDKNEESETKEH